MKNHLVNGLILVLMLGVLLGACNQAGIPAPKDTFIMDDLSDATTVAKAKVIAEVIRDGHSFTFIDESQVIDGGGIGVLEMSSEGKHLLLPALERLEPTALEVFLALSPASTVPNILLENHAKFSQAEPRRLGSSLEPSNISGPLDQTWCHSPAAFQNAFHSWFFVGFNYKYEGYGLNLWGAKKGVTGVANRRALAACNRKTPYSFATVNVRVEAQLSQNLWVLIPGTIKTLVSEQGMYYFSEGWTAQRYRISANGHHYTEYHLAGAWGKK